MLDAKKKAKHLVFKFRKTKVDVPHPNSLGLIIGFMTKESAKELAIICVDELKDTSLIQITEYWEKVKEEIKSI